MAKSFLVVKRATLSRVVFSPAVAPATKSTPASSLGRILSKETSLTCRIYMFIGLGLKIIMSVRHQEHLSQWGLVWDAENKVSKLRFSVWPNSRGQKATVAVDLDRVIKGGQSKVSRFAFLGSKTHSLPFSNFDLTAAEPTGWALRPRTAPNQQILRTTLTPPKHRLWPNSGR